VQLPAVIEARCSIEKLMEMPRGQPSAQWIPATVHTLQVEDIAGFIVVDVQGVIAIGDRL
jgi:hypothetical protein